MASYPAVTEHRRRLANDVFAKYSARGTNMSRWLIGIGIVLVVAGLLWPWLSRLGLGRLPGDIHVERDGFHFFFPITTGLIISVVLTLILWIFRR